MAKKPLRGKWFLMYQPVLERWPSGRRHAPAKGADGVEPSRGFESLLLRHFFDLTPARFAHLRGDVLPERVPSAGLLILRDGEPGDPEVTLSPLRYHYQHRAEIEAVMPVTIVWSGSSVSDGHRFRLGAGQIAR